MIEITISDENIDDLVEEHNYRTKDALKHWQFDDVRRYVIKSWDDVQACPGSGKTTLVAAKLLILAKKWEDPYRGICVLTHTNVARDEIVSRLQNHPSGFKLTSYPHFIGTIQEFVNRFLGLPYCRSNDLPVTRIDDDVCVATINRNISFGTKSYLDKRYANLYELKFRFENNDLLLNVPGFSQESKSKSYTELKKAKGILINNGLFFFSEMYCFAEQLVEDNPDVLSILRERFPIVLIDEMQDTQKSQDNLINQIFANESVCLQRLGDPDQALFDNIGGDEPNESYNNKDELFEIKTSHRFGLDICEKIIGLSYNNLDQLLSVREPDRGDHLHTVFTYDEASQERVLEAFGALTAEADPEGSWKTVKAVGGVDGESGQIRNYWSKFDKTKSATSPRPKKLIHILHICQDMPKGHVSSNYDLLVQGVLDLLRKAGAKTQNYDGEDVYFSRRSLITWLRDNEKYIEFRKLLTSWILNTELDARSWEDHVETVKSILELDDLNGDAADYMDYDAEHEGNDEDQTSPTNKYVCANGRNIELGTIHSVKGETHDATLILETKFNRWFDVLEMLPFMLDTTKGRPVFTPNSRTKDSTLAQYMRKLFVAGSRPRHLLCIALHEDHVTPEQVASLNDMGWSVTSV